MDNASVLSKNEGFTVRDMDGETLFLDTNGSAIHVADEVGSFIYGQIDGVKTLGAVLSAIVDTYEIDAGTAETDLYRFCGEMVTQRILEIRR